MSTASPVGSSPKPCPPAGVDVGLDGATHRAPRPHQAQGVLEADGVVGRHGGEQWWRVVGCRQVVGVAAVDAGDEVRSFGRVFGSGGVGGEEATRREADQAEAARVDPPLPGAFPYEGEGAPGVVEGEARRGAGHVRDGGRGRGLGRHLGQVCGAALGEFRHGRARGLKAVLEQERRDAPAAQPLGHRRALVVHGQHQESAAGCDDDRGARGLFGLGQVRRLGGYDDVADREVAGRSTEGGLAVFPVLRPWRRARPQSEPRGPTRRCRGIDFFDGGHHLRKTGLGITVRGHGVPGLSGFVTQRKSMPSQNLLLRSFTSISSCS
ncbi:hypothetical protein GA0115260_114147 [Streptomyces sp. MnatMP-M27]|nr:hypothetical protein GA0115260_114147 [Streptomyces sp. MnatMP-M27]